MLGAPKRKAAPEAAFLIHLNSKTGWLRGDATISSLIPALTSGKIEIISAAMSASPERAKVLDFTDLKWNLPASVN